ncbi:MAG: hypothetical protein JGK21_07720 [Microcoleus sp. PH2017_22_RUC_O_B]|uniref:AAA family ATPase n=1 Tax=unclassified Microcoleus TaxID=2642155 RepID=UPI001D4AB6D4|nr:MULTISPECIES: AAA family ATPase [unclassified Microcoleus]MCC3528238.1 hypothetical protein [Microcoleus sp. PH2017_21_RUC_O_A]MCC3540265.1 hypothetical protein [Microcoleus sp. PH2017_22_RUC_O_B]
MNRFLRETWELWYWAMFCPSRLQQRMNEWVPAEEKDGVRSDTHSSDILLFRPNSRFIAQFVLLIFLFSLPLIWGIALHGQAIDFLLLFEAIVTAYSIGIFCLSIGFHIPLLVDLVYPVNSEVYQTVRDEAQGILPPGLFVIPLALILTTTWFCMLLLKKDRFFLAYNFILIGGTISAWLGSWLAIQNWYFALVATGLVGLLSIGLSVFILVYDFSNIRIDKLEITYEVALFVVVFLASIMIFIMAIIMSFAAVVMAVIIVVVMVRIVISMGSIATLPLPFFLLTCWLIAASLSPTMQDWLAIITTVMLTALGFEDLNWMSLLAVPVTLISYYRLPDYFILTFINFLFDRNPVRLLHLLPPYTTELVWLPLLNHDRILAAAFRTDASATLATFQKMQTSPLPGLRFTIEQALPQIITDQLNIIRNIYELIAIATPEHPFLPLLAPTFYQIESLEINKQVIQTVSSSSYFKNNWSFDIENGTNIDTLLPRLQIVAKDVDAALKGGNIGIRKRALEPILTYLLRLELQLPKLGLTTLAIKRWKPVLAKWRRVIELELQEQQQQSQDELLNPFQYGNPLRSDRANLFRGRQKFADEIVRLILDRNRPTLVLHGPRRCGKTSFLYNLPRLLPSSLLPVYLDLQSSATTTDEAAFCQGLVRAIHRDSRSQGIELPITPTRKEFLETPYITLEDWLEQALPRLGERRLLLNLDEFEKIGTAIKEKRLSLNLLDELRHLIQHYDSLAFLFSGVQTLDELGPNWSSYFISVVPLEMTYLEPDEAESLLTNPDPEFALRYERGIVEEIIQLTRCQPYLLQLLGSALVTQANLNHTQLVTPDLLQAAIPEAFTNGEPYFTNVWTEFTGNNPAEIIAGQEFLLELANGLAPGHSQDLTDAAIGRLRRYHAIEQTDNGYVFEVPLLERWVRERAVKNSNF